MVQPWTESRSRVAFHRLGGKVGTWWAKRGRIRVFDKVGPCLKIALHNTAKAYGWIAIALHWLSAAVVLSLLGLGLYMVELDYYDAWYNRLPWLHKSIGMLFVLVLLFQVVWRGVSPAPEPLAGTSRLEQRLARLVHWLLLTITALIVLSGYLISTAEGAAISVFDWFSIPATVSAIPNQVDNSGLVHRYLSYALIALVVLHVAAALKHHFIDRNNTLRRILGIADR